jgi:aspartate/methionine/tyrosine aminotransferase
LREIGVAITPGIDFDPDRGRNFVRFSYAGPRAAIHEAARRIRTWLKA